MPDVSTIPPSVLYGAFGTMAAAITGLWAFLTKSIERERKRSDRTTTGLRKELAECEVKHAASQQEMFVLSGKVNAVIGHNEGYIAARDDLQGLPESVDSIDQQLTGLSKEVLRALHHKDSPDGSEGS